MKKLTQTDSTQLEICRQIFETCKKMFNSITNYEELEAKKHPLNTIDGILDCRYKLPQFSNEVLSENNGITYVDAFQFSCQFQTIGAFQMLKEHLKLLPAKQRKQFTVFSEIEKYDCSDVEKFAVNHPLSPNMMNVEFNFRNGTKTAIDEQVLRVTRIEKQDKETILINPKNGKIDTERKMQKWRAILPTTGAKVVLCLGDIVKQIPKKLLNQSSMQVTFNFTKDRDFVSGADLDFCNAFEQTFTCGKYFEQNFKIGFNYNFLSKIVNQYKGKNTEFTMYISSSNRAVIITVDGKEDINLIMPVMLDYERHEAYNKDKFENYEKYIEYLNSFATFIDQSYYVDIPEFIDILEVKNEIINDKNQNTMLENTQTQAEQITPKIEKSVIIEKQKFVSVTKDDVINYFVETKDKSVFKGKTQSCIKRDLICKKRGISLINEKAETPIFSHFADKDFEYYFNTSEFYKEKIYQNIVISENSYHLDYKPALQHRTIAGHKARDYFNFIYENFPIIEEVSKDAQLEEFFEETTLINDDGTIYKQLPEMDDEESAVYVSDEEYIHSVDIIEITEPNYKELYEKTLSELNETKEKLTNIQKVLNGENIPFKMEYNRVGEQPEDPTHEYVTHADGSCTDVTEFLGRSDKRKKRAKIDKNATIIEYFAGKDVIFDDENGVTIDGKYHKSKDYVYRFIVKGEPLPKRKPKVKEIKNTVCTDTTSLETSTKKEFLIYVESGSDEDAPTFNSYEAAKQYIDSNNFIIYNDEVLKNSMVIFVRKKEAENQIQIECKCCYNFMFHNEDMLADGYDADVFTCEHCGQEYTRIQLFEMYVYELERKEAERLDCLSWQ